MIFISAMIVFILSTIWNIILLIAILDFLAQGLKIKLGDWAVVILGLSLWFFTGVYLFGM